MQKAWVITQHDTDEREYTGTVAVFTDEAKAQAVAGKYTSMDWLGYEYRVEETTLDPDDAFIKDNEPEPMPDDMLE